MVIAVYTVISEHLHIELKEQVLFQGWNKVEMVVTESLWAVVTSNYVKVEQGKWLSI